MNIAKCVALSVASLTAALGAPSASAAVVPDLYGITNSGQLIGINATTGAGSLLFSTVLRNCEALEHDPATGQLFVIASTSTATAGRNLYRLNPATGVAALIGATGYSWVESLALHPTTGVLYASASSNNDVSAEKLITIDTATGVGTLVANFGAFTDVDAMAFSPTGELFATQYAGNTLATINPDNAAQTTVATGLPLYMGAMDFAPDGTLFASRLGDFNGGGNSTLRRIDPTTGAVTLVGDIGFVHVAGIVANIPAPSSGAALALLGAATLRRRRA